MTGDERKGVQHCSRVDVETDAAGRGQPGRAPLIHHHVRHAAHQILAEADLGVHPPGRGEHGSGGQVAEMGRDGGRADVERHPEHEVAEAGPDRHDLPAMAHGDGDLPVSPPQGGLEFGHDVEIEPEVGQLPLLLEGIGEPLAVPRCAGEIGLVHLDVVETDDGINRQGVDPRPLADDLAVHLAGGGDIDHHVVEDAGGAAEPVTGLERPPSAIFQLDGSGRREPILASVDPRAAAYHHLAAAADAATAANRIEVDPQLPGSVEDGGAGRNRPPPS
jgi:hypothetical protein